MDQPAPGKKQPPDAAEELRLDAVKVQENLKRLLKEVAELIEKTKQLSKDITREQPPPP